LGREELSTFLLDSAVNNERLVILLLLLFKSFWGKPAAVDFNEIKKKKIVVARFAPVIRTTCNVEKTLLNQMFAALFLFVSLSSTPTSLEIVYNFR
jgi:hypothetical protein